MAVCSFALNTAHNSANRAGCIFSTLNSVSPNAIDSRHFATIINIVVSPYLSTALCVPARARRRQVSSPKSTHSLHLCLSCLCLSPLPFYRRHVRRAVHAAPKIITTVIVEMSSIPTLHLGKEGGVVEPGDGKGWLRQFSTYSSAGEGERERRRTNSTPSAGIWQVTALVASVPSCSNARGPTITVQCM